MHGYIEAGKKEGAKVILGGEKRSGKGFFVDPTSEFLGLLSYCTLILRGSFHRYQAEYEDRKYMRHIIAGIYLTRLSMFSIIR